MRLFYLFIVILFVFTSCNSLRSGFNNFNNSLEYKKGIWIELSNVDTVDFEIIKYKKGIKQGYSEIHLSNGNIAKGKYQNGKKHGAWRYFKKESKTPYLIEYYTEGYVSRLEFIKKGKVVRQVITDPPF